MLYENRSGFASCIMGVEEASKRYTIPISDFDSLDVMDEQ